LKVSKTAVALMVLALCVAAPFVIRASASFFLTHKYEELVRQRLSPTVSLDRLRVTRQAVDDMMKPLRCRPIPTGGLPDVYGEPEAIRQGYALGYYLLDPRISGCQLYFVFDGPHASSTLVGYFDSCE
jgi:hypothetical protein